MPRRAISARSSRFTSSAHSASDFIRDDFDDNVNQTYPLSLLLTIYTLFGIFGVLGNKYDDMISTGSPAKELNSEVICVLVARPPQLAVARRVGRLPPIIDAGSRWRRSLTLTGPSDTATNCRFKRPSREALDQMRQADRDAWSASEHRLGDRDRELWESNGLLLYELRRQGQDELADDLAQYHTERLAAAEAEAEAEQKQQETAGQGPAGEFWQQADLHIPPPTYKDQLQGLARHDAGRRQNRTLGQGSRPLGARQREQPATLRR
jgi:hypothetical protein